MKSRLAASFLAAAFSIALPLFNLPQEKALSPQGSLWYEPSEPEIRSDSELYITLLDGERTLTLSMEEYLYGAVAAEMPASFHIEALKAQAVALRTYALYKIEVSPSENHDEDLCSSSSCCAAWKPDEYLREKWGADYALYSRIIHSAVSSTDGEYLVFGGEPALAVFHASSDGKTESSAAVWGKSLPYLVSVDTPESVETVRGFEEEVFFSRDELLSLLSGADAKKPLISDEERTESGRLASVTLFGVSLSGRQLRSLLGLGSTAVELTEEDGGLKITARGRGHGVGMSQFGADLMAKEGADYREILSTYYPGTELTK